MRVLASSQKMDRLINDLLALSQLGSQGLNIIQVNLSELVRKVWGHLQVEFPDNHVLLQVDETPPLFADHSQMEILLTNLLSNAIKFTRNTPEPAIHFGSNGNEGQITFFLKDNGIGFEMEYQRKIFTPFERLNPTEFEGTGIGLAIVNLGKFHTWCGINFLFFHPPADSSLWLGYMQHA
ncbi:MAG: ATP-binding protein [Anaerolineales bacterium]